MNDKRKIVAFLLALLGNFTFLATSLTGQPTEEAKKLPECIRAFGEDSLETRRTMAVLIEDFKNQDYPYAYKWYTYMFTKAPCAYVQVYQYGPYIMKKLIIDQRFADRRKGLIDTLMMSYPTRIKYFGEEGQVKAFWAFSIGQFTPENIQEALQHYAVYIEKEKDRLDDVLYIKDYMSQAVKAHKKSLYSKEELFSLYDELSTISEAYKSKYTGDSVKYTDWYNAGVIIDNLMAPYLKCADIDAIYGPKIKAEPENKDLIIKVIRLYRTAGPACKDNQNYNNLLEKSFELEPNATAAEGLAAYFDQKKQSSKATSYYEKAAELSTDPAKKEEIYLKLAKRVLSGNIAQARSYASKVLEINPNNGTAIIIQGIALYKNKCGDKFEMAMAACAAVEKFNYAKSVDPSCAQEANAQIATHKKYYPLKADAFFRGLKDGDSYTIPCSGITATVQTR